MADIGRRQQPTTATLASSTVHSELQWRSEEEEDDSEEHTEDSASSSSDEREPLHIETAAQQQQCYLANSSSESQPFSNHIGVTPNHPGNPSLVSLSRPTSRPLRPSYFAVLGSSWLIQTTTAAAAAMGWTPRKQLASLNFWLSGGGLRRNVSLGRNGINDEPMVIIPPPFFVRGIYNKTSLLAVATTH